MIARQDNARWPGVWRYGRRRDGIEIAAWTGTVSPRLAQHFHDHIQITAVTAGRRRFLTPGGPVTIAAGSTFVIPPGLPHQAVGLDTGGTQSLNLYLDPDCISPWGQAIIVRTPPWLEADAAFDRRALRDWVCRAIAHSRDGAPEPVDGAIARLMGRDQLSIGEIASRHGASREGFIIWFRHRVGMTPHAYRLACRLNRARALLAAGVSPAIAAAEAGFSDQSHMGRQFRLAFGATPGLYQRAVRRACAR